MKHLVKFILLAIVVLSFGACCPKGKCVGSSNLLVEFNYFSPEEADTVIVIAYQPNSNFSTVVDTTLIPGAYPITSIGSGVEYDYRLILPGTKQIFDVNGFEVRKIPCNGGWFCHDKIDQMNGYSLNGKHQTGESIELFK